MNNKSLVKLEMSDQLVEIKKAASDQLLEHLVIPGVINIVTAFIESHYQYDDMISAHNFAKNYAKELEEKGKSRFEICDLFKHYKYEYKELVDCGHYTEVRDFLITLCKPEQAIKWAIYTNNFEDYEKYKNNVSVTTCIMYGVEFCNTNFLKMMEAKGHNLDDAMEMASCLGNVKSLEALKSMGCKYNYYDCISIAKRDVVDWIKKNL